MVLIDVSRNLSFSVRRRLSNLNALADANNHITLTWVVSLTVHRLTAMHLMYIRVSVYRPYSPGCVTRILPPKKVRNGALVHSPDHFMVYFYGERLKKEQRKSDASRNGTHVELLRH